MEVNIIVDCIAILMEVCFIYKPKQQSHLFMILHIKHYLNITGKEILNDYENKTTNQISIIYTKHFINQLKKQEFTQVIMKGKQFLFFKWNNCHECV